MIEVKGHGLSLAAEVTVYPWHEDSQPGHPSISLLFQYPSICLLCKTFENKTEHQFSSVAQSCPTLCNPVNRSTPDLPVHHQLLESIQTHVHCVSDAILLSSVVPFSSCPQSFPASGSFQMSQLFASGGQNIVVSASTSVLAMNTQD